MLLSSIFILGFDLMILASLLPEVPRLLNFKFAFSDQPYNLSNKRNLNFH